MFTLPSVTTVKTRVQENWKAALTVALISIPLSIALSIASGALTTVLFAATLTAPLGLGAAILPILALFTGAIVFIIWLLRLERYLYYIPSDRTVLFAATLTAPLGLGAAILPILALFTGAIVFIIWLLRLERYLYYIP